MVRNSGHSERVLVVIPTYNERESLPITIDGLLTHAPEVDVLVVDDNSPDGTGEWADIRAAEDTRVHVMHRTAKNGLGAAYLAGFAWALDEGYDIICEMDADGSHRPQDFPRLLAALDDQHVDLAIGSRWTKGGKVENWPFHRELLSRGGNFYVKALLALGINDATAGFRAFRARTLRALDFDSVSSHGYCFQVDMSRFVIDAGGVVREVPITFVERVYGDSKMSGNIVKEALGKVTVWGFQKRTNQIKSLFSKETTQKVTRTISD